MTALALEPTHVRRLQARLLSWYANAKRDLPWRRTRDPYAVWISETMLQQTRTTTVIPFYERFLAALPTVGALAEAPQQQVLALWSGLGYYRRARMLHAAAKHVVTAHGSRLPEAVEELRGLQGVGAYTAGAIASIAFGRRAAVVDGNVARVLARLYSIEDDVRAARGNAGMWALAQRLVDRLHGESGDWNQALMELGATVCLPREPRCDECPVRGQCSGRANGIAEQLPRMSRKGRPLTVQRVAVVLASPARVVLARRRVDLLFGGLWEPPSTDGEIGPLAARLQVDLRGLDHVGDVVHVLSHRRMEVKVMRGALARKGRFLLPGPDYDAVERVAHAHLGERPQASLTRKILEVANVCPRGLRSGAK
jgi:A/G-specific adenine glycosylase